MKRTSAAGAVGNPFSALKHKNYRYYWIGMTVSTTGTWMQLVAQPWLALQLTNSPFKLGLIGALQFLPQLLFSLFAGVIIEKFPKKNLLFATQISSFLIVLGLAILTFSGHIMFWHLAVSSTLLGFVNTIDMPTRQSFVIELVGKDDLTNGIALNSVQFNLARIVGPALAGVIMGIGTHGVANCFLINAISFGAVIISLFFVHPYPLETETRKKGKMTANIAEGLKFIISRSTLYMPLLFLVVGATFAMNFNVLVPVFTTDVLHLDESAFGLLMSMSGVGALVGALTMATVSKGGVRKVFLYVFPLVVGVLIVLIGFISTYLVVGFILMLISFFYMIFMASVNTTMQMNATNEFRGRVMSVYTLVVAGSTPLGNLFAGTITENFGAGIGFVACGATIIVLLLPLYTLLRKNEKKNADIEVALEN